MGFLWIIHCLPPPHETLVEKEEREHPGKEFQDREAVTAAPGLVTALEGGRVVMFSLGQMK